jgi:hypothetical protein
MLDRHCTIVRVRTVTSGSFSVYWSGLLREKEEGRRELVRRRCHAPFLTSCGTQPDTPRIRCVTTLLLYSLAFLLTVLLITTLSFLRVKMNINVYSVHEIRLGLSCEAMLVLTASAHFSGKNTFT